MRSILSDAAFRGVQPRTFQVSSSDVPHPDPLKVIAYADEVFVFLHDPADVIRLLHHVRTYEAASNARFNTDKTQAIVLSGSIHSTWPPALAEAGITTCDDRTCPTPVIYLGFPLYSWQS